MTSQFSWSLSQYCLRLAHNAPKSRISLISRILTVHLPAVQLLALFVLFCVVGMPCQAQATLDNFTSLRTNPNNGNSPIWVPVTGAGSGGGIMPDQTLSVANGLLTDIGSQMDSTVYTVATLTAGATTTITLTSPANWVATQTGVTFSNVVGTGCSMLPTDATNPLNGTITTVNSTTSYVLNLNTTGCSLTSANVFLNCAKSCGVYFMLLTYPYVYSENGFMGEWVQSGTWSANYNRMNFSFVSNVTSLCPNCGTTGDSNLEVGAYIKSHLDTTPTNQGVHPYHDSGLSVYAGQTYYVELNWKMFYLSGGLSAADYPWNYGRYYDADAPFNYFDGMTHFYFTTTSQGPTSTHARWSRATIAMSPVTFSTNTQGEADTYVGSLYYGYTGFQSGVTNGRYDIAWQSPPNVAGSMQIAYSTADMHVNGFSSGTLGTTQPMHNSSNRLNTWSTPDIYPQPAVEYIALRPIMGIGWAATAPSGDIMVTTGNTSLTGSNDGNVTDFGMANGSHVTVANVGGCTAANGNWTIGSQLPQGAFNTVDSTLTQVVVTGSSGAATATTSIPHGLTLGRVVQVIDYDDGYFMQAQPVTNIVDPYNFQFTWQVWPGLYMPAGTYNNSSIILYYGSAAVLTGSGPCNAPFTPSNYTGNYPTMASTDNTTNFTEVQITSAPIAYSACDINHDGVVNVLDVQLYCNQNMPGGTCTNAVVQPIITAALGGVCTLQQ